MKKIPHKLIAGASILASALTFSGAAFTHLAIAQSVPTNVELAQLIPSDVDQFVELNTAAANPFSGMMDSWMSTFMSGSTMSDASTQSMKDILTAELKSNKISFASKNVMTTQDGYSYPMPQTYMSIHMTADDYAKLITLLPSDATKETIDGMIIYGPTSNSYFTMVGNLVVSVSTHDRMTALLDMYTKPSSTNVSLAQSAGFMAVTQKNLANSFLNMYINPNGYTSMFDGTAAPADLPTALGGLMSAEKNIMGALTAEGISVAQTSTGFNFSVLVKGDAAKLTQLNLNFDRYNFVPELYKYINSNNVIMFSEENNLEQKIKDMMQLFASDSTSTADFTTWKNELRSNGNVDFDNDLLPLFTEKYAVAIHQTSQIYPAVTFVFDVRSMRDKASSVLTNLVLYADKSFMQMEKDQGVNFYNRTTAMFNGTTYYEMSFDPTKTAGADPSFKNLSSDKVVIKLHAAVTNEGFLVITTAPNVSDVFTVDGKGMMNNSDFSAAFTNPGETTAGVAFMSFDTIKTYADMLMTTFNAPAEAQSFVDGLLNPWHNIYTKAYGTPDSTWATGSVKVDTAGFAAYGDLFNKYMNMADNSMMTPPVMTKPQGPTKTFCDVHDSDWYAQYVNDLSNQNIVSGYNDGCFKPNNQITRAEFIKMVLQAQGIGSVGTSTSGNMTTKFKDVSTSGSEWYDNYVYQAVNEKIASGYSDGTFRPNAPITRAEAVQILYNMSDDLKSVSPVGNFSQFNDVHNNDWFTLAVHAAFVKGLIQGTNDTTFAPNMDLTRAEASKIISVFMSNTSSGGLQYPMAPTVPPANPQPGMMMRPMGYTQQDTQQTTGPNIY